MNPGRKILLVSACDHRFMPLLRGMMASIAPVLQRSDMDMACFDIGLNDEDREWLSDRSVYVTAPGVHFGLDPGAYSPALRSFLARPFLREYFPGYDVYLWIDSDVWLQDLAVLSRYVDGAVRHGLAVTHERERAYRFQAWLLAWTVKHFVLGYGPATAAYLLSQRHLNAGMFAAAADAPQWNDWAECYGAAIQRTGALVPHDQFALNQAIYRRRRGTEAAAFLDPSCNWICDRGVPMWNDEAQAFCKPYAPYEAIGALHLAGPAKHRPYTVHRTSGGTFDTFIVHGASPDHPGRPVTVRIRDSIPAT